jgi:hypothetical protein
MTDPKVKKTEDDDSIEDDDYETVSPTPTEPDEEEATANNQVQEDPTYAAWTPSLSPMSFPFYNALAMPKMPMTRTTDIPPPPRMTLQELLPLRYDDVDYLQSTSRRGTPLAYPQSSPHEHLSRKEFRQFLLRTIEEALELFNEEDI